MKNNISTMLDNLIDGICSNHDCRNCPYTKEIFGTHGEGGIDACDALMKIRNIALLKELIKDNYNLDTEKRSCRECDGDPNLVRNNWCAKCEKLEGGGSDGW